MFWDYYYVYNLLTCANKALVADSTAIFRNPAQLGDQAFLVLQSAMS